MTKQEALNKIKELEEYVEELDKESKYKPEPLDKYWFIDAGAGRVLWNVWDTSPFKEANQLAIGNVFLSEEEAESYLEYLEARQRIKRYIYDNGLEFTPDWGDEKQWKHYIYYDLVGEAFYWSLSEDECGSSVQTLDREGFYFKSGEDAREVINNCEEDLKILFGVS